MLICQRKKSLKVFGDIIYIFSKYHADMAQITTSTTPQIDGKKHDKSIYIIYFKYHADVA